MADGVTAEDVTVLVVTYNSDSVLGGLIESIPAGLAGCSWQLTIVDNDSRDNTIPIAKSAGARLIRMGRNAGYAAGINAGLAAARAASALLVLNPDTRLEPGAVAAMLECMRRRRAGIVVPRLVGGDGHLIYSLRREPTALRSLGDAVVGARRAGRYATWGEEVTTTESYEQETVADWATGAALLISSDCIAACGPWDESFFLYSEETEYCLRARNRGFPLVLTPRTTAVHLGGDSKVSPTLRSLLVVNRIRLYRRTHSPLATMWFWAIAVIREVSRVVRRRPASREVLMTLLSRRRMLRVRDVAAGTSWPPQPRPSARRDPAA